jgi:uncharacterized RDD family membrane protein YckC
LWRRLAAIGYDGFLLAGIWMVAAMAVTVIGQVLPAASSSALMRIVLFCAGFGFFGWFWTHGGQTLGMRAWRVRVARADGAPVHASSALLRYMTGLLPPIAALYAVARFGWIASPIAIAGLLPCFFDRRGRALHDFVAGTELSLVERGSAQGAQPQQGDEDEHDRRQAG